MKETNIDQKWTHVVTEFLPKEEGEVRLILDEDRTSIEISTGEGESIELVPTKTGDLEIYMEDNYQTRMLKKEFLDTISKQIEQEFGIRMNRKNFINRSVLAALIKLRSLFGDIRNQSSGNQGHPRLKPNQ